LHADAPGVDDNWPANVSTIARELIQRAQLCAQNHAQRRMSILLLGTSTNLMGELA
jgi:hypothetical protein